MNAIGKQIADLEDENNRLRAENERLREALDLIANTGMDARQCMLTARNALKST